jgi:hypothetical protein
MIFHKFVTYDFISMQICCFGGFKLYLVSFSQHSLLEVLYCIF